MGDHPDELVTLRMSARIWSGIDADVDNAVSIAAVALDRHVVGIGGAIREAGWAQVPWIDGAWPPMDQDISIGLTRAQWHFAAEVTRKSIASYESLGDDESAQLARDALTVIDADVR